MKETCSPDFTKPLAGLTPFPSATEVFAPDEQFLAEHLHPLFSIDLSLINPDWNCTLHMLSPIESHENLPGDLTVDLGVHGPMLQSNWIGFRIEDGRYRLSGNPRYFFLHPDNRYVPEPLPGARESLIAHYKAQHDSYLKNADWYQQHGTIGRIDWGSSTPVAYVGQLGGAANGNQTWARTGEFTVELEQQIDTYSVAYPISPKGRRFHHIASVPGFHYRQYGADTILMFYEPVEQLVVFTFDF